MICCNNCFCDSELKPIIEGLGKKGDCQICHGSNVYIYDTDEHAKLVGYFDEFISIYTPVQSLPAEFPKAEIRLLKDELLTNWSIFNKLDAINVYKIITCICSDKYQEIPELFDSPVGIAELYNREFLNEHSLLKTNSWEGFVNALKKENRFHTKHINLEILERFCSFIRKSYKKGTIFYRGRISSSSRGLRADEMGAPLYEKVSGGRANAPGIRCLYLASDIDTTIHEVRAGAFDFITVGKFQLQEDIIVVDLKLINKISPFTENLDYLEHAINKEHLNKINAEMGKALRRSDSPLDYVPTQYISDFIKSIKHKGRAEYAGLEYNSTMKPDGFNLAIFYPDLFRCIDVENYMIKDLIYRKEVFK
ncbi:RES family NAD+ phosphorylase [Phosphitispora fastidiosa]|uniref:RES family NAD+ phosphorylase n=1 Tax=Phosphitispora fastidiosa TaxID=2837202 RepID=UPI001E5471D1|nr:RES family NAD+ phosphorylase [Phosphitispora fastidiosa]